MAEVVVAQRMWQRRGTTAEWNTANPVLAAGEIGVELTTPPKTKVGDGVTAWTSLAYIGVSDKYYRHVQGSPSATWTVTHNLGKRPAVSVVDSAGSLVEGDISYTNDNTAVLTFVGAFSGEAYFS